MSLILKQEPANTIATPPAGKTTMFVTETNVLSTKGPDGNVTEFPTVQGANTQVFYNDDGAINGDSSFTFNKSTDLVTVANLTVTGTLIAGDIAVSSIANGTSNVDIVGVSGNVTVSVGGNANILTATGTGVNVAGTLNATGNANVGNLGTNGNVSAGGIKTDNLYYANGSPWDLQQPAGSNTYVQYNNSDNFGASSSFTYNSDTSTLSAPNIAGTLTTAAQTNITSVGTLSSLTVTANIAGGNLTTGGQVVATGNVTGGNLVTGGVLSVTGNANVGNIGAAAGVFTGNVTADNFITSGNISGANVISATTITATGNVTGGNLTTGGVLSVTGNANVGNIGAAAGVFTANISSNNLSTTNRVTAGNGMTVTTGGMSITGNIDVTGNFNVTGNLNYSNVTDLVVGDPLIYLGANNTGNLYDLGLVASYNDGSYVHTGIARNHNNGVWTFFDGVANEPTTVIDWANATYPAVKVGSLTATTTISITGNANVGNLGTAGLVVATGNVSGGNLVTGGALSVTGNANVGNLGTAGLVVATGNVTGGNLTTAGQLVSSVATGTAPLVVTSTTQVANLNVATAGVAGTVTTAAQPNITSVGTLTSLAVTGNITGGNLIGPHANGNSNINIPSANGNVNISAVGNANIVVVTGTGANVAGTLNVTGNIIGGTDLYVGNGAASTSFTNPVAIFKDTGLTYVQVAAVNSTGTGSADMVTYGNNGDDTQSWTDMGFTGNTFNDANYTVTAAGDGYLFVQGNSSFGGNLVLATGNTGTTKDIVFATGGFLAGNIKARLYNANGTFSVTGNVAAANIVASSYTISSVATAISAAGTVQGNATAITKDVNVVSTVASGAGVVLPTAVAGMRITILNTSANALLVYPASSGIINSLAANAAYSAPAGSKLDFLSTTTTQWYTLNATYN